MPKARINLFILTNPNKSKKNLYHPDCSISGFDAAEIKGIITDIPTVSMADNAMDIKKRTTR
jgi:hypothetical protein